MKTIDEERRLKVLILEDQMADAELCEREMRATGLPFVSCRVDTLAGFEAALERFLPDLILSDFSFPAGFDGLDALDIARRKAPEVPFVFVSGTLGEERAVEAMRRGAADYVLKDRIGRLGTAARQAVEYARLRRQVGEAQKALQQAEARKAALVEAALDCVITVDHEGTILEFNPAAEAVFGYRAPDIIGTPLTDRLIPPSYRARHLEGFERYLRTGEIRILNRRVELSALRSDGTEFPIELTIVRVGTEEPPVFTAFLRDITVRRQREMRIERLSRIRALLSGINAAIVRSASAQQLFDEACRIAVEHGGFEIAWIGRFDAATLDVMPVAWAGVGPEEFTRKSTARADQREGQGAIGRAVRERRPVFINDLTEEREVGGQRREVAIRRGFRSLTALPLIVDGAVTGHISLFARERNFFNEEEVGLLTEFAGNISFALESMARREKIARLSRIRAVTGEINAAIVRSRNRQLLFYEACRIAVEHGGFGIAWIGQFDARTMEITPVATAGLENSDYLMRNKLVVRDDTPQRESVAALAIREGRPVCNNDITVDIEVGGERRREAVRRGYRSVIALPLRVEGAVAGTFSMFAKDAGFFTDEEIALLTELAGNLSFALENMARQEKLERLSRIRMVSSEINAAIVRIPDRRTLLQETARIAAEQGNFGMVWVAEIDPDARAIRPVAWTGFSDEAAHGVTWASIGAAGGTLGEAIASRTAAVRNDIGSDLPVGRLRQEAVTAGCFSTVCLPLVVDVRVAALVALFAGGRDFFDANELALLNELAADVSFALRAIAQREKVEYLSYYDPLTGLPNRALFIDRAGQQMRSRGGEPTMVALILVNIERFRNINEAFGRQGGDDLLTLIAQRLETAFRGKDYIARVGADGFGVVVRGLRDATAVLHVVENQVLGCFREPYPLGGQALRVGARVGVALYPADGQDADALFRNAEAALKNARDSGERYLFYAAEMNARAVQVLSLETRLRVAVEEQQFVLHYQPKLGLGAGKEVICGLEALIRWQEPGGDLVAPGTFIPLLEETGLILEVGKWALERALADHRAWTARGVAVPRIAVNVSPIQLQQRDFADLVIATIHQQGDRPEALELEVTESLLMRDVEASTRKLSVLRSVGIHVAMDDFGTGYSSLSYIARLPLNSVKIDRSFINGMAGSPQDMAIVTTIIALAHSLNLRVVAEGVETREQARLLALLKCDEAQGYLYSKPLPADEIEPLLRSLAPGATA